MSNTKDEGTGGDGYVGAAEGTDMSTAEIIADLQNKYQVRNPSMAEFFAPPELAADSQKEPPKLDGPNADYDLPMYTGRGVFNARSYTWPARDPSPSMPNSRGRSEHAANWAVPQLTLQSPTPPPALSGLRKTARDRSSSPLRQAPEVPPVEPEIESKTSQGVDLPSVMEPQGSLRDAAVSLSEDDRRDAKYEGHAASRDEPLVETSNVDSAHMPGSFDDDVEAVLQEPDDGSRKENGQQSFYRTPYYETVSDLGFEASSRGPETQARQTETVTGETEEPARAVRDPQSEKVGQVAQESLARESKLAANPFRHERGDSDGRVTAGFSEVAAGVAAGIVAAATGRSSARSEKVADANSDEHASRGSGSQREVANIMAPESYAPSSNTFRGTERRPEGVMAPSSEPAERHAPVEDNDKRNDQNLISTSDSDIRTLKSGRSQRGELEGGRFAPQLVEGAEVSAEPEQLNGPPITEQEDEQRNLNGSRRSTSRDMGDRPVTSKPGRHDQGKPKSKRKGSRRHDEDLDIPEEAVTVVAASASPEAIRGSRQSKRASRQANDYFDDKASTPSSSSKAGNGPSKKSKMGQAKKVGLFGLFGARQSTESSYSRGKADTEAKGDDEKHVGRKHKQRSFTDNSYDPSTAASGFNDDSASPASNSGSGDVDDDAELVEKLPRLRRKGKDPDFTTEGRHSMEDAADEGEKQSFLGEGAEDDFPPLPEETPISSFYRPAKAILSEEVIPISLPMHPAFRPTDTLLGAAAIAGVGGMISKGGAPPASRVRKASEQNELPAMIDARSKSPERMGETASAPLVGNPASPGSARPGTATSSVDARQSDGFAPSELSSLVSFSPEDETDTRSTTGDEYRSRYFDPPVVPSSQFFADCEPVPTVLSQRAASSEAVNGTVSRQLDLSPVAASSEGRNSPSFQFYPNNGPYVPIRSVSDCTRPLPSVPFRILPETAVSSFFKESELSRSHTDTLPPTSTPQDATITPTRPTRTRVGSSTAVPLKFRLPLTSPGVTQDSDASSPSSQKSSPLSPMPRIRHAKASSSEFKSNEFRPLYLLERNRRTSEVEDDLPALPPSKATSRSASTQASDEEYQSALETPGLGSSRDEDDASEHHGEYFDSQQTTPRATAFPEPSLPVVRDQLSLNVDVLGAQELGTSRNRSSVPEHQFYSATDFSPIHQQAASSKPLDQAWSHNIEQNTSPTSAESPRASSLAPLSKIQDIVGAGLIGTIVAKVANAVGANGGERSNTAQRPVKEEDASGISGDRDQTKYTAERIQLFKNEYLYGHDDIEQTASVGDTELIASHISNNAAVEEASSVGLELPEARPVATWEWAEIDPAEAGHSSAERSTVSSPSREEQRKQQEQDVQDAVSGWFEQSTSFAGKTSKKGTKSKASRGLEALRASPTDEGKSVHESSVVPTSQFPGMVADPPGVLTRLGVAAIDRIGHSVEFAEESPANTTSQEPLEKPNTAIETNFDRNVLLSRQKPKEKKPKKQNRHRQLDLANEKASAPSASREEADENNQEPETVAFTSSSVSESIPLLHVKQQGSGTLNDHPSASQQIHYQALPSSQFFTDPAPFIPNTHAFISRPQPSDHPRQSDATGLAMSLHDLPLTPREQFSTESAPFAEVRDMDGPSGIAHMESNAQSLVEEPLSRLPIQPTSKDAVDAVDLEPAGATKSYPGFERSDALKQDREDEVLQNDNEGMQGRLSSVVDSGARLIRQAAALPDAVVDDSKNNLRQGKGKGKKKQMMDIWADGESEFVRPETRTSDERLDTQVDQPATLEREVVVDEPVEEHHVQEEAELEPAQARTGSKKKAKGKNKQQLERQVQVLPAISNNEAPSNSAIYETKALASGSKKKKGKKGKETFEEDWIADSEQATTATQEEQLPIIEDDQEGNPEPSKPKKSSQREAVVLNDERPDSTSKKGMKDKKNKKSKQRPRFDDEEPKLDDAAEAGQPLGDKFISQEPEPFQTPVAEEHGSTVLRAAPAQSNQQPAVSDRQGLLDSEDDGPKNRKEQKAKSTGQPEETQPPASASSHVVGKSTSETPEAQARKAAPEGPLGVGGTIARKHQESMKPIIVMTEQAATVGQPESSVSRSIEAHERPTDTINDNNSSVQTPASTLDDDGRKDTGMRALSNGATAKTGLGNLLTEKATLTIGTPADETADDSWISEFSTIDNKGGREIKIQSPIAVLNGPKNENDDVSGSGQTTFAGTIEPQDYVPLKKPKKEKRKGRSRKAGDDPEKADSDWPTPAVKAGEIADLTVDDVTGNGAGPQALEQAATLPSRSTHEENVALSDAKEDNTEALRRTASSDEHSAAFRLDEDLSSIIDIRDGQARHLSQVDSAAASFTLPHNVEVEEDTDRERASSHVAPGAPAEPLHGSHKEYQIATSVAEAFGIPAAAAAIALDARQVFHREDPVKLEGRSAHAEDVGTRDEFAADHTGTRAAEERRMPLAKSDDRESETEQVFGLKRNKKDKKKNKKSKATARDAVGTSKSDHQEANPLPYEANVADTANQVPAEELKMTAADDSPVSQMPDPGEHVQPAFSVKQTKKDKRKGKKLSVLPVNKPEQRSSQRADAPVAGDGDVTSVEARTDYVTRPQSWIFEPEKSEVENKGATLPGLFKSSPEGQNDLVPHARDASEDASTREFDASVTDIPRTNERTSESQVSSQNYSKSFEALPEVQPMLPYSHNRPVGRRSRVTPPESPDAVSPHNHNDTASQRRNPLDLHQSNFDASARASPEVLEPLRSPGGSPIEEVARDPTGIRNLESPGADVDFAATLAAGLEYAGFDTNIVLDDAAFHRRESPASSALEPNDDDLFANRPKARKPRKVRSDGSHPSTNSRQKLESEIEDIPQQQGFEVPPTFESYDEFMATLAAGLQTTGFDPDAVLGDPMFSEQDTPFSAGEDDFPLPDQNLERQSPPSSTSIPDATKDPMYMDDPLVGPEGYQEREIVELPQTPEGERLVEMEEEKYTVEVPETPSEGEFADMPDLFRFVSRKKGKNARTAGEDYYEEEEHVTEPVVGPDGFQEREIVTLPPTPVEETEKALNEGDTAVPVETQFEARCEPTTFLSDDNPAPSSDAGTSIEDAAAPVVETFGLPAIKKENDNTWVSMAADVGQAPPSQPVSRGQKSIPTPGSQGLEQTVVSEDASNRSGGACGRSLEPIQVEAFDVLPSYLSQERETSFYMPEANIQGGQPSTARDVMTSHEEVRLSPPHEALQSQTPFETSARKETLPSNTASIFPGLERVKRRAPSVSTGQGHPTQRAEPLEPTEQQRERTISSTGPVPVATETFGAASEDFRHRKNVTARVDMPGYPDEFEEMEGTEHRWALPIGRDSGIRISDAPSLKYDPRLMEMPRDSGYHDPTVSPLVGLVNEEEQVQGPFEHSPRLTGTSASSADPLSISVEVDPSYQVNISRHHPRLRTASSIRQSNLYHWPPQPSAYAMEEGTGLLHPPLTPARSVEDLNAPSPVESTTKDRTSYLFHSSPPGREAMVGSPQVEGPRDRGAVGPQSHENEYWSGHRGLHGESSVASQSRSDDMILGPYDHEPVAPRHEIEQVQAHWSRSPDAEIEKLDENDFKRSSSEQTRATGNSNPPGRSEHGFNTAQKLPNTNQSFRNRVQSARAQKHRDSSQPHNWEKNASSPVDIDMHVQQKEQRHDVTSIDSRMHSEPPKLRRNDRRSVSSHSNRSSSTANHHNMSERLSPVSNRSSTPGLRRVSQNVSGDLRATSKLEARAADAADAPAASTSDDFSDQGRGLGRNMSRVPQGWGGPQGSPMQGQLPNTRKRQNTQSSDLESRLNQVLSENRILRDARAEAERNALEANQQCELDAQALAEASGIVEARDHELRSKEEEIESVNSYLRELQQDLATLKELNEGLTIANKNLSADTDERYATIKRESAAAHQQWQQSARELESLKTQHEQLATGMENIVRQEIASALEEKNSELQRLRQQLESAKMQIMALQQQVLTAKAKEDFLVMRDEDYLDSACQQLCQHVQQWVLRFSKYSDTKRCRLLSEIADEKIETRLEDAILDGSDVDTYLSERIQRRDVFMSVVMKMIWEFVFTRYLFGLDRDQRHKLKLLEKTLSEVGPPRAVANWRATTLTLLSRRPQFLTQRVQDTEAVAQEIYNTLSTLLPPLPALSGQIIDSLRNVLKLAVTLSIEMRTQRAEYIMLPPLQPEYDPETGALTRKVFFNAALMNERSGDPGVTTNEDLERRGAVVRMVLFPLVVKKGDDLGEGEEEIVVAPAQVLIARPTKDRKVVRVMSGALEIERPRSMLSGMSGLESNMI